MKELDPFRLTNYDTITDKRELMEQIARIQATQIPALLTVMSELHNDMLNLPYDEPLRGTADFMMRDAAVRLGFEAMHLMLGTKRLRELITAPPPGEPEPTHDDEEFPF